MGSITRHEMAYRIVNLGHELLELKEPIECSVTRRRHLYVARAPFLNLEGFGDTADRAMFCLTNTVVAKFLHQWPSLSSERDESLDDLRRRLCRYITTKTGILTQLDPSSYVDDYEPPTVFKWWEKEVTTWI